VLAQTEFPEVPAGTFTTLLLIGFVIGGIGKLYQSRFLIALAIVLIVIAVIVLPMVTILTGRSPI
jgi:sulfite exporter TauE/SafE